MLISLDRHGRSIDGRKIAVQWAKRPPSSAWRHDGYVGFVFELSCSVLDDVFPHTSSSF